jgi:hypothetical protein
MAVYSDVDICCMALGHVGLGQKISDLDGSGALEEVCRDWFARSRDTVLEGAHWPVSTRQVILGLVEEDPNTDWAYSYRYPNETLAVRRLVSGVGLPETDPVPFVMGQDDTGRLIYADLEDAIAEVTYWTNNSGEWSSHFANAVSFLLASNIAGPLKRPGNVRGDCYALFEQWDAKAKGVARREEMNKPRPPSSYVSRRN